MIMNKLLHHIKNLALVRPQLLFLEKFQNSRLCNEDFLYLQVNYYLEDEISKRCINKILYNNNCSKNPGVSSSNSGATYPVQK